MADNVMSSNNDQAFRPEDIKNLVFDLGGVIMDIEKDNCVRAFQSLGLPDAPAYFGEFKQQGPFALVESGAITPDQFRAEIKALIPNHVSDAEIDNAFCQFLIGIPVRRLQQLRDLRKKYGVYLLSNTNPIMWNSFIASQFRQEGLTIDDYFDGITTSFEAKSLKPAPEIFDYACRTMGISGADSVFLDDSEANCEAARRCGWHALHVPQGAAFEDILYNNGLL